MNIINEHFKKHPKWPRPEIECADGFRQFYFLYARDEIERVKRENAE